MTNDHTKADFSLPAMEEAILDFWAKNQAFEASLIKRESAEPFLFYDGPPFATGLPHHGHLLASTVKDIVPRYFTMRGYHVARRFGWDCHGLPIEHEIDKKLGLSADDAVKQLGIKGYSDECRSIVQRYVKEWRQTITRLGRWIDFNNDYKTMDTSFMESVWWVFKQLWEKDLIYLGNKVVPFSTALGTVLSNFEASSNYQSVQDPAITVLFKSSSEPLHFAAWTTTPWTLPSNLGLAVDPEMTYAIAHDLERNIDMVVAQATLEAWGDRFDLTLKETRPGSAFVGMPYEPLFPYFSALKEQGAFHVFAGDFIVAGEGTGVVHMAPAFGEDDQRVMMAAGVKDLVCPIDHAGRFTQEVSDYQGQYVKDADKEIIKDLKQMGVLFYQDTLVHNYPFCPRSDTPLIYRAVPSWYVKVDELKQRLVAANQKIHWVPSHIQQGRFGQWLEGARDWAISRNRVWGTPLPIWFNATSGQYRCVGSIEELAMLSGVIVDDLHRDHVDPITFSLEGEDGVYERIPEVLDCWFESGSMPYAQNHYPFENADTFKESFPAAFIAEGLDQTRGWFYTLMVLSVALFDVPAFQNVIVTGIVMAEDGKKMSKRLQNYTAPDALMDQYGADALRLYLIHSGLVKGEEQRFADTGVQEMVRRTLLPWLNAFKFFETYAKIDQWTFGAHAATSNHVLDGWIRSRLQSLLQHIEAHMKQYHLYQVVPKLLDFIDELTNIYIRYNRQRFWAPGMEADKCAAFTTLYTVLNDLSCMMAPFTPFMAEYIYQQLGSFAPSDRPLSVHWCDYPVSNEEAIRLPLEAAVSRMQQIILMGRQQRNEHKIKVKTPLRALTVVHQDKSLLDEIAKLETIIMQELNVKAIHYDQNEAAYIHLHAKPCSPRLGKRFGKDFPVYKKAIEALSAEAIRVFEESGQIDIEGEAMMADDVLVYREAKEGSGAVSNRLVSIVLDTELDDALREEGMARELVSLIQKARKDAGFEVIDRIEVYYEADDVLALVVQKHREDIMREVLALRFESADVAEGVSCPIDGHVMRIRLSKVSA